MGKYLYRYVGSSLSPPFSEKKSTLLFFISPHRTRPYCEANLPAAVTRRDFAIPHAHAAAAVSFPVLWHSSLARRRRRRRRCLLLLVLDAPVALRRRVSSFVRCAQTSTTTNRTLFVTLASRVFNLYV